MDPKDCQWLKRIQTQLAITKGSWTQLSFNVIVQLSTQDMVMNFNLFLQGGVLRTLDSRHHNGLTQKEQNYF